MAWHAVDGECLGVKFYHTRWSGFVVLHNTSIFNLLYRAAYLVDRLGIMNDRAYPVLSYPLTRSRHCDVHDYFCESTFRGRSAFLSLTHPQVRHGESEDNLVGAMLDLWIAEQ